ncbi:MAG: LexA family transcriptional regulator [Rhizobiales bacterium]|nr:LexA family transcriptional regulator [Hyphomicrobiales bacterium]
MAGDFGGNPELDAMARQLRAFVKNAGGNQKVADAAEVPLSTLNTILAGKSDPRISTLKRLAPALGMSFGDLANELTPGENTVNSTSHSIRIPLRDVFASSGPGCEVMDEAIIRHLSFDPFFVESWGIPPERVEAVINRGDSNEPTIRDGAVVLIDRGDRKLRERPIFAFRTPDGLRLKRFQKLIDGSARLVSDNQALYAPEVIGPADMEQLRVVGRAFWTGMEL